MRKVLLVVLTAMTILLVGCIHRVHDTPVPPVEGDHPLVGVWSREGSRHYLFVFNSGGTGSRGSEPHATGINWGITEDGYLTMRMNRQWIENWDFEINENVLTLTNRETSVERNYIREQDIPSAH